MADKKGDVQSVRNADKNLHSFELGMADGRTITIDAPDEETAKRAAREQAGNVGVLTAKKVANPDKAKPTDDGASAEEAGNGGGEVAPSPAFGQSSSKPDK